MHLHLDFETRSTVDLQQAGAYVYATAAGAREHATGSSGGSAGGGLLLALLAVGGSVLAAGAALVAWAHS